MILKQIKITEEEGELLKKSNKEVETLLQNIKTSTGPVEEDTDLIRWAKGVIDGA